MAKGSTSLGPMPKPWPCKMICYEYKYVHLLKRVIKQPMSMLCTKRSQVLKASLIQLSLVNQTTNLLNSRPRQNRTSHPNIRGSMVLAIEVADVTMPTPDLPRSGSASTARRIRAYEVDWSVLPRNALGEKERVFATSCGTNR